MLTDTVKQLQSHKSDVLARIDSLQSEVSKIDEAIAVLASVNGGSASSVVAAAPTGPKTRMISAAGIARIKAAQKLRWAKFKKAAPAAAPSGKAKPKFSAAGIAKIRAAQKLRWAKYNAAKAGK